MAKISALARRRLLGLTAAASGRLVVLASCALLLPAAAFAQGQSTSDESWQFAVTAYAYLPQISGTASFPVSGVSGGFTLDQQQLLDHLKMTFMGAFDAHRGRWGFFTDLLYMNLGARKTNSNAFTIGNIGLPAGTTSDVSLDLKSWIVNAVGEYRVVPEGVVTLDAIAGLRYLSLKNTFAWSFSGSLGALPPAVRTGSSQISDDSVDGIIGVKGQVKGQFYGDTNNWRLPFYLDVGSGGSDFTWQGAIGLAYVFHWGELGFLYRYLDYEFSSSKQHKSLSISGPLLGATFRW